MRDSHAQSGGIGDAATMGDAAETESVSDSTLIRHISPANVTLIIDL